MDMTARKTTAKPRTKKVVEHFCTQEEAIARINAILVGNGHPEDGLAYKVLAMHDNIENIKDGVGKLQGRAEANAKAASSAVTALDMYKKEMLGIDMGKSYAEKTAEKKWKIWFEVLGLLFVAIATITSIIIGLSNNTQNARIEGQQIKIENEIKNITPDSFKVK